MKYDINKIEKDFKPFKLEISFERPEDILMFLRYYKKPTERIKRHPITEDILNFFEGLLIKHFPDGQGHI